MSRKASESPRHSSGHKYIVRVDCDVRGVHYYRVKSRDIRGKCFSDSRHASKQDALAAAIRYRDKQLAGLSYAADTTPGNRATPRRNYSNKSGVLGVSWDASGGTKGYWIANYYEKRHRFAVRMSVAEHGNRRAFLLACRERYRRRGELTFLGGKMPASREAIEAFIRG